MRSTHVATPGSLSYGRHQQSIRTQVLGGASAPFQHSVLELTNCWSELVKEMKPIAISLVLKYITVVNEASLGEYVLQV